MRKIWFYLYLFCLVVWSAIAYAVIWRLQLSLLTFVTTAVKDGSRVADDFCVFYTAGWMATRGEALLAYNPVSLGAALRETLSPLNLSGTHQFQYPPHFLAIFRIIGLFPLETAWCVWTASGIVLSVLSVLMISTNERARPDLRPFCITLIMFLCSFPAWICLKMGQSSFLLLFAVSLFHFFLKTGRPVLSALPLYLVKLQYAPAVIIAGVIGQRIQFLKGLALTLLLVLIGSISGAGWNGLPAFLMAVMRHQTSTQYVGAVPGIMQNFRGALIALAGEDNSVVLATCTIAWIASLVLTALMWLRLYPWLKSKTSHATNICVSITVLAMLIFSLNTYIYDYTAALIPCYLLYEWATIELHGKTALALRGALVLLPGYSWITSPALFTAYPVRFVIPPMFTWTAIVLCLALLCLQKYKQEKVAMQQS